MLQFFWFSCSSYKKKNLYKKNKKDSTLYAKNDMDSSESVGAKGETPNQAFALVPCDSILESLFACTAPASTFDLS
jgi:hypothetical protein